MTMFTVWLWPVKNHWGFYQFMFGNGGAYVTEDQQANINTPEVKGTLEFMLNCATAA